VADLLKIGKDSNQNELKKPIFTTDITDNLADAYTFHNLKPATIYKVQFFIHSIDIFA